MGAFWTLRRRSVIREDSASSSKIQQIYNHQTECRSTLSLSTWSAYSSLSFKVEIVVHITSNLIWFLKSLQWKLKNALWKLISFKKSKNAQNSNHSTALLPDLTNSKSISRKRECLKNCHICKGFYGDNFMGHLCAQTCVKLDGQIMPNCNELISIAPFLKPSSQPWSSFYLKNPAYRWGVWIRPDKGSDCWDKAN